MNEKFETTITAIGTGALTGLLGGWDSALEILLIVIIIDYLTGVAGAFKTKTVNSSIGYTGIMKKASIFAIVILAVQIDRITQNPNHLFRNSTAFFFIANEALSIIENAGIIGIKLPNFLQSALVKLRNKNSILPEENSNKQEGKDE
mgnify:FL=1